MCLTPERDIFQFARDYTLHLERSESLVLKYQLLLAAAFLVGACNCLFISNVLRNMYP